MAVLLTILRKRIQVIHVLLIVYYFLFCAALQYAVLHCVELCRVILRYAVLCYAVLCYAVIRYAVMRVSLS